LFYGKDGYQGKAGNAGITLTACQGLTADEFATTIDSVRGHMILRATFCWDRQQDENGNDVVVMGRNYKNEGPKLNNKAREKEILNYNGTPITEKVVRHPCKVVRSNLRVLCADDNNGDWQVNDNGDPTKPNKKNICIPCITPQHYKEKVESLAETRVITNVNDTSEVIKKVGVCKKDKKHSAFENGTCTVPGCGGKFKVDKAVKDVYERIDNLFPKYAKNKKVYVDDQFRIELRKFEEDKMQNRDSAGVLLKARRRLLDSCPCGSCGEL